MDDVLQIVAIGWVIFAFMCFVRFMALGIIDYSPEYKNYSLKFQVKRFFGYPNSFFQNLKEIKPDVDYAEVYKNLILDQNLKIAERIVDDGVIEKEIEDLYKKEQDKIIVSATKEAYPLLKTEIEIVKNNEIYMAKLELKKEKNQYGEILYRIYLDDKLEKVFVNYDEAVEIFESVKNNLMRFRTTELVQTLETFEIDE